MRDPNAEVFRILRLIDNGIASFIKNLKSAVVITKIYFTLATCTHLHGIPFLPFYPRMSPSTVINTNRITYS